MNNEPIRLNDDLKLFLHITDKFYKELLSYNIYSNNREIGDLVTRVYNRLEIFKNEYDPVVASDQELSLKTHLNNLFSLIYNIYYNRLFRFTVEEERNLIINYSMFING